MKKEVIEAIDSEREYQLRKHGQSHKLSIPEALIVMQTCLTKAWQAWADNGNDAALYEVRQVTAVGVACLEHHGAPCRALCLDSAGSIGKPPVVQVVQVVQVADEGGAERELDVTPGTAQSSTAYLDGLDGHTPFICGICQHKYRGDMAAIGEQVILQGSPCCRENWASTFMARKETEFHIWESFFKPTTDLPADDWERGVTYKDAILGPMLALRFGNTTMLYQSSGQDEYTYYRHATPEDLNQITEKVQTERRRKHADA